MNFIKRKLFSINIFALLMAFSINTSMAQDIPAEDSKPKQERKRGDREVMKAAYEAMLDSLNLTEQQREEVDFINSKYRAQMQQIRQNNEGDREAMRSDMMELREKQNTELKEILSEEQFAKYQKWMKENRQRRRGSGRPSQN